MRTNTNYKIHWWKYVSYPNTPKKKTQTNLTKNYIHCMHHHNTGDSLTKREFMTNRENSSEWKFCFCINTFLWISYFFFFWQIVAPVMLLITATPQRTIFVLWQSFKAEVRLCQETKLYGLHRKGGNYMAIVSTNRPLHVNRMRRCFNILRHKYESWFTKNFQMRKQYNGNIERQRIENEP